MPTLTVVIFAYKSSYITHNNLHTVPIYTLQENNLYKSFKTKFSINILFPLLMPKVNCIIPIDS